VLQAALDELVERGYADFRIERIALRANVHKATIYRHWPDRSTLAREAIAQWRLSQVTPVDTGAWSTDLRALLHRLRGFFELSVARALTRVVITANTSDPDLVQSLWELWRSEASELLGPIERAQERGEVAAHIDAGHVVGMLTGPILTRALVTMEPIDDDFLESLYEVILAGTATTRTEDPTAR
jgi:AcrR family transcriptional regulator